MVSVSLSVLGIIIFNDLKTQGSFECFNFAFKRYIPGNSACLLSWKEITFNFTVSTNGALLSNAVNYTHYPEKKITPGIQRSKRTAGWRNLFYYILSVLYSGVHTVPGFVAVFVCFVFCFFFFNLWIKKSTIFSKADPKGTAKLLQSNISTEWRSNQRPALFAAI